MTWFPASWSCWCARPGLEFLLTLNFSFYRLADLKDFKTVNEIYAKCKLWQNVSLVLGLSCLSSLMTVKGIMHGDLVLHGGPAYSAFYGNLTVSAWSMVKFLVSSSPITVTTQ